jgi:hypothetical protein
MLYKEFAAVLARPARSSGDVFQGRAGREYLIKDDDER